MSEQNWSKSFFEKLVKRYEGIEADNKKIEMKIELLSKERDELEKKKGEMKEENKRQKALQDKRLNDINNKIEISRAEVGVKSKALTEVKRRLEEKNLQIVEQDLEIEGLENEKNKLENQVIDDAKRLEETKKNYEKAVEDLKEKLQGESRTRSELELELSDLEAKYKIMLKKRYLNNIEINGEISENGLLKAKSQMETYNSPAASVNKKFKANMQKEVINSHMLDLDTTPNINGILLNKIKAIPDTKYNKIMKKQPDNLYQPENLPDLPKSNYETVYQPEKIPVLPENSLQNTNSTKEQTLTNARNVENKELQVVNSQITTPSNNNTEKTPFLMKLWKPSNEELNNLANKFMKVNEFVKIFKNTESFQQPDTTEVASSLNNSNRSKNATTSEVTDNYRNTVYEQTRKIERSKNCNVIAEKDNTDKSNLIESSQPVFKRPFLPKKKDKIALNLKISKKRVNDLKNLTNKRQENEIRNNELCRFAKESYKTEILEHAHNTAKSQVLTKNKACLRTEADKPVFKRQAGNLKMSNFKDAISDINFKVSALKEYNSAVDNNKMLVENDGSSVIDNNIMLAKKGDISIVDNNKVLTLKRHSLVPENKTPDSTSSNETQKLPDLSLKSGNLSETLVAQGDTSILTTKINDDTLKDNEKKQKSPFVTENSLIKRKLFRRKCKTKDFSSLPQNKMVRKDGSASPINKNNDNSADKQQKSASLILNGNQNLTDASEKSQENSMIQEGQSFSLTNNIDVSLDNSADEHYKPQNKNNRDERKSGKRKCKSTGSQSQQKMRKKRKKNTGRTWLESRLVSKSRNLHKKK